MNPKYCEVIYDEANKKVRFESAVNRGLTISQVIEDDEKYGKMVPVNGKYFTFRVLNEDQEFTKKEAKRAMRYAQKRWSIYANLPKFKLAKLNEIADFTLKFETVESDPDQRLNENTVMYNYYPISDVTSKFRGLCVVNKKFFYTTHGNSVKGTFLQSKGFQVQFPNGDYGTLDFDQIYGHELGHALGLPHDPEEGNLMSFRVDIMAEFCTIRDQLRIIAKYGKSKLSAWHIFRWLSWLIPSSDR